MGRARQTVTIVKTTTRTRSKKSSSTPGTTSPKGGNPNRCPTCGKYTSKS